MKNKSDYDEGAIAAVAWNNSPIYAQFDRTVSSEYIMSLFLPPVPQDLMQISRPLPKPYADWLRGFNEHRGAVTP